MDVEIKQVMTPTPHSVAEHQTLQDARSMMQELEIRHLPVRKGKEVIGVITERDIDFAARVDGLSLEEMKVQDAYTSEPYAVSPTTLVSEVARTMGHKALGCAIIIENGELTGIFTAVDACKLLGEALSGRPEQ